MFSRFGKGGWDCVTKGNVNFLLCASVVAKYTFSPLENDSGDMFLKTFIYFLGILYSLRILWSYLCFLLDTECDKFVLSTRRASSFTKPVFTLGGWSTKKLVYILGLCLFVMCLIYNLCLGMYFLNLLSFTQQFGARDLGIVLGWTAKQRWQPPRVVTVTIRRI